MRAAAKVIATTILWGIVGCSEDDPRIPLLDITAPTPSAVAAPALRVTLPASWDENWYSSPAVFDLDHDDDMEIIASRHSVLYVWKDDTLLWRAPVGENASTSSDHGSSRMYCSPAVGDMNNDGFGEVAISYDNQAAVYDRQGNLLPGWPQTFPGPQGEIRSIAASDVNNDGICEILVVKTSDGPVTNVWTLAGATLAGWPQLPDHTQDRNDYGGYNQNIGSTDLDGDGVRDIVCTYDICHIGIFRGDGSSWEASPIFSLAGAYASSVPMFHDTALAMQGWGADGNDRDEFTDSPPAFADMDGDGRPEIVLFSDHERAGEYVNRGNSLWVLNPDMTRVPAFSRPLTTGLPLFTGDDGHNIVQVAPAPCIARLSGSDPCIVVPSYDGWMRCYGKDGAVRWSAQFDAPGAPFIGAGEAAAADLDGDGTQEIVFTTYSTDPDISNLVILDAMGNLLHRVPIGGRGSMAAPTIADVDGDSVLEIVLSLKDVLGSGLGGVQIWEVASAIEGVADWPTGRGNFLRTGEGR